MISAARWVRRIAGPRLRPISVALLRSKPGSTVTYKIDKSLGRLPVIR